MKTVYVPNNKYDHDLSDTKRFGEVVILTEDKVPFNIPELRQMIKQKMSEASEDDFLLLLGSPLMSSLCFAYLLLKNGRVNLLVFNAKSRVYEVKTVMEGDMNED
jgi:hypothetical protein